jgi:hypothetical protein
MNLSTDVFDQIRTLLAAASTAEREAAIVYLAKARAILMRAGEDLRALALLLVARERELVVAAQPKTQEELGTKGARS